MIWGISPLLGFLLSPLIGSLSDRCRSKFGRRRPLIVMLSIGIIAGLLLVPNGINIGNYFGDPEYDNGSPYAQEYNDEHGDHYTEGFKYKWALLVTVIGIILLDFSADVCQSPARAYILDMTIAEDHSKGLSAFGIMCGVGSFFGFLLCTVDWSSLSFGQFMGGNITTVFIICTIAFVGCVITTVTSFREIPLPLMEVDELLRPVTQSAVRQEYEKRKAKSGGVVDVLKLQMTNESVNNNSMVSVDHEITRDVEAEDSGKDDEDEEEVDRVHVTLLQYLKSVVIMPKSIRILCLTHLFTKMALLSYSLYFTDFVGEVIFVGNPMAPSGSEEHDLYDQGVRFGCFGLAAFALSCTLYSIVIDKLIKILGARFVYIGGLAVFSLGMVILAIYPMRSTVILVSFASGIMYATACTVPYLILAQYHGKGSFKQKYGKDVESTQIRGVGTDVSILHSMIFVGQIIVSISSGPLISLINSVRAVIYAAGFFAGLSAIVASQIVYMDL